MDGKERRTDGVTVMPDKFSHSEVFEAGRETENAKDKVWRGLLETLCAQEECNIERAPIAQP